MYALLFRVCFLLLLLSSSSVSAVTMDWTPIGNPGNACDPQLQGCFGAVGYAYQMGTYEVTNAQYAEFLNAKAASDPLGLYSTNMGDPSIGPSGNYGGITRSGSDGSYTYSVIAGRGDMPVNWVTFFDTLRFTNWMNNGQANSDTETGAYTLLGGTATPSNGDTVTRNAGATIVLTSEDEWYKAAYYNALSTSYFAYPAASDAQTTCAPPSGAANQANCSPLVAGAFSDFTTKGSYTGSASPYGTFDQGGNVFEWNEAILTGSVRGGRGGSEGVGALFLAASTRVELLGGPSYDHPDVGFRVAMIPEPGTGLLMIGGLFGLVGWRRCARSASRKGIARLGTETSGPPLERVAAQRWALPPG
jgi:formylglycine-generating enzyme required for sulfatase activity